ncbi:unnamed protein product [Prorocentrum cordatum]|uniref:Uncharacterized protein n=1 Tax=Prorocentrum cordatum TaxID=2364126 RepID=A0ABN9V098_9DINO|nr:unnamed protein product [Polarella glacialis]
MARLVLLAVALGACRADEQETPPDWAVGPNWRHLVDCADWGDDCTASQCCKRPGTQCYGKNEWYSSCVVECAPGSTPDGEEWTCEELGERTPTKAPEASKASKTRGSKASKASVDAKGSKITNASNASKGSKTTNASNASKAAKGSKASKASMNAKGSKTTNASNASKGSKTTNASNASKGSTTTNASKVSEDSNETTTAPPRTFTTTKTPPATTAKAPTSAPPATTTTASPATPAPSPAPTSGSSAPTAAPSAAPTAAPPPAPTAASAGGVESLSGAEPSKRKATSTGGGAATTTAAAAMTSTTDEVNSTTARAEGCDACTALERTAPDVVIPFWEHDLCKLGYTVESIARHDPNHVLGTVILMWVSQQPIAIFQEAIDKLKASLDGSHEVKIVDFSPQVNQGHVGGWLAQQVFKLKAASLVESDFYVVLDAKNTLIRDLEPDAFFTPCNQGKIYGEFEPDQIPEPHAEWYQASAAALGVQPPGSSGGPEQRWPTSITPMVIHRSTVLDLLDFIHEDRSTDNLCGGPLCEMLGARSEDGKGATEFTLFVLFARTRINISCDMAVEETSKEAPMALSLWRGLDPDQMDVNLRSCKSVASGEVRPWMFGSQTAALEALTAEQFEVAQAHIVDIYTAAGLHDVNKTSTDALMRCVAGDVEGVAGPIEDIEGGGDEPVDEDGSEEQPEEQRETPGASGFCCADAQDAADICGTCWPGATMHSDSYCGTSQDHCSSCRGTWCGEEEAEEAEEAEEEPPSEEEAQQLKVLASCEEFKCKGWDRASPCACTALCEQVCDDELLEIRMQKKFSASAPPRPAHGALSWASAALPPVLLAALAATAVLARRAGGAREARRWAPARWLAGGPPVAEREALVPPEEGPACSA